MDKSPFIGTFLRNVIVECFSDQFFRKTTQQSGGSCKVKIDFQLFTTYSTDRLFISANKFKKMLLVKNSVLFATMTRCAPYPIVDITKY